MGAEPSEGASNMRILLTGVLLAALCSSGCVYALQKYNIPSQHTLVIQGTQSTNVMVRVANEHEYPVANDGRVTFEVPRLPRGCAVYLFGAIKIRDGKSEDVPVIQVFIDDTLTRTLSLSQLDRLPLDDKGYRVLSLK
jgi:hypothetical protein